MLSKGMEVANAQNSVIGVYRAQNANTVRLSLRATARNYTKSAAATFARARPNGAVRNLMNGSIASNRETISFCSRGVVATSGGSSTYSVNCLNFNRSAAGSSTQKPFGTRESC